MPESLQDQIARAAERLDKLKERQRKAEARARVAASKKNRAAETRRKILAGALCLDEKNGLRAAALALIGKKLTREDDRALFNLPPLSSTPAPTPAAPPPEGGWNGWI